MPSSPKVAPQSQKFIDAAKDLGADVDEETLRRKLEQLAKAKPVDRDKDSKDKDSKSR